jgi:hypothetical protein
MPMGGQNRKPTVIKERQGTLQRCRANPNEPQLTAVDLPSPPEDLRDDEKVIWSRLAAAINGMQVATAVDVEAFRVLVRAVARAERTDRDPAASVNQKVQADRLAAQQLQEWGLTPASRQRVSQLPGRRDPDADDPLALPGVTFPQSAPGAKV